MATKNRKLNVFLCYSKDDKSKVRKLYHRLDANGIDAWLDDEKLMPGQDWVLEIMKAVLDSDTVVVFLSNSYDRRNDLGSNFKTNCNRHPSSINESCYEVRNGEMAAVWLSRDIEAMPRYYYKEREQISARSNKSKNETIFCRERRNLGNKGKVIMVIRKTEWV